MLNTRIHRARGFSLVELMVGLVIGMIGVVIMMQIFSVSEGYKRTTTGGDDAQNNGAISLYGLQRDLRQAGQGTNSFNGVVPPGSASSLIGCNVTLRPGVTINANAPVTINHASIPAGDAGTDTLLVFHGNSDDSPEGDRIAAQPATNIYRMTGFAAAASAPAIRVGDRVVAHPGTRPSPCNLSMEAVASVAGNDVTVGTGAAGMSNGALFNLGSAPRIVVYAVRGGALTMCDYMVNNCGGAFTAAHWVPIASNVVSLRAQYGHDTTAAPMDLTVDAFNQTTPTTECGWVRMRAIRVALVARSAQLEKDVVTPAAPSWAASAAAPIDLSADADWQRYRYKLFETVVPLRNVAWLGVQSGC
jgi:type IV pilus assembly protein PilW